MCCFCSECCCEGGPPRRFSSVSDFILVLTSAEKQNRKLFRYPVRPAVSLSELCDCERLWQCQTPPPAPHRTGEGWARRWLNLKSAGSKNPWTELCQAASQRSIEMYIFDLWCCHPEQLELESCQLFLRLPSGSFARQRERDRAWLKKVYIFIIKDSVMNY